MHRQPLDQQRIIDPQDINPVAQRLLARRPINQDIVAGIERRRHRVALDPDQRQFRRWRGGDCLQPARIEREIGPPALVPGDRAGTGRRAHFAAHHRHQRAERRAIVVGHPAEHRFGHLEIARQRAPLAFLQLARRPLAQILLNIGVVAADQPRQRREIFAPLGAQFLEKVAWRVRHNESLTVRKFLDK